MREIADGRYLAGDRGMNGRGDKTGCLAALFSFFYFLSNDDEGLGGGADMLAQGNDCAFGNCCGNGRFVCCEVFVISRMHTSAECIVRMYCRGFHSVSPAI